MLTEQPTSNHQDNDNPNPTPSSHIPSDVEEDDDDVDVKMEACKFPTSSGPIIQKSASTILRQMTKRDKQLWKFVFRKSKGMMDCPVVDCDVRFRAILRFFEHYRECCPNKGSPILEECPICNQRFPTDSKPLMEHIREEHEKNNMLLASDDDDDAETPMKIKDWVRTKRHLTKDLLVEMKDFCISDLKEWLHLISLPAAIHKRKVSKKRLRGWDKELLATGKCTCNIKGCRTTFTTKPGIIYHSAICGLVFLFKCKPCSFSSTEQHTLLKHMVKHHKYEYTKSLLSSRPNRTVAEEVANIPEVAAATKHHLVTPPSSQTSVPRKRGRPRKRPECPNVPEPSPPKGKHMDKRPTKSQPTPNTPSRGRSRKKLDLITDTSNTAADHTSIPDQEPHSNSNPVNTSFEDSLPSDTRHFQELEVSRYSFSNRSIEEDLLDSNLDKSPAKESILSLAHKVDQMIMAEADSSGQDSGIYSKMANSEGKIKVDHTLQNRCRSKSSLLSHGKNGEAVGDKDAAILGSVKKMAKKNGIVKGDDAKRMMSKGPDIPRSNEATPKQDQNEGVQGLRRSSRKPKPPSRRFLYSYSDEEWEENVSEHSSSHKANANKSDGGNNNMKELKENSEIIKDFLKEDSETDFRHLNSMEVDGSRPKVKGKNVKKSSVAIPALIKSESVLEDEVANTLRKGKKQSTTGGSGTLTKTDQNETDATPKKPGRKPKPHFVQKLTEEDLNFLIPWKDSYEIPQEPLRTISVELLKQWENILSKENLLKCPQPNCSKTFVSALGLKYHYQRCGVAYTWDCLLCDKHFEALIRLKNHLNLHHAKAEKGHGVADNPVKRKKPSTITKESGPTAETDLDSKEDGGSPSEESQNVNKKSPSDIPTSIKSEAVLEVETGNTTPLKRKRQSSQGESGTPTETDRDEIDAPPSLKKMAKNNGILKVDTERISSKVTVTPRSNDITPKQDHASQLDDKVVSSEEAKGMRRSSRKPKPPPGRLCYSYLDEEWEEEVSEDSSSYKASADESDDDDDMEDLEEEDEIVEDFQVEDLQVEESGTPKITDQNGTEDTPQKKKKGRKPKLPIEQHVTEEDLNSLIPWKDLYRIPQEPLRTIPAGLLKKWETMRLKKSLLKCPLPNCSKTFGTTLGLKYHYQRCGVAFSWDCLVCNKHFDGPDKLRTHFGTHSADAKKGLKDSLLDFPLLTTEKYAAFLQKYYHPDCFSKLLETSSQWPSLTEREYQNKLPIFDNSVRFKEVMMEEEKEQVLWKVLKRFGSTGLADSKCNVIFHTGGPVLATSWCPVGDDPTATQFLALAASISPDDLIPLNVPSPLIQIWSMGDLSGTTLSQKPQLAFAFKCPEDKQVMELKWCPSGCWRPGSKLGLLAVAFHSQHIHIYSVPHPDQLPPPTEGDLPIYSAQPVLVLEAGPSTLRCTCLTWDPSPGHSTMAAGFTDGHIFLWKLDTTSRFLRRVEPSSQVILSPINSYRGAMGDIMSIQLSWNKDDTSPKIVLVCGQDRKIHRWDTQMNTEIRMETPYYNTKVLWPPAAQTFFFVQSAFGEKETVRGTTWSPKPNDSCVATNAAEINCCDISMWNRAIVSGDAAGNIIITPHSTYSIKLNKKDGKKTVYNTSEFVIRCRTVNLDQEMKEPQIFRFTYDQMASTAGVVFSEFHMNLHQKHQPMCDYDVNNYLLSAVRTVEWNPNRHCNQWLLTSYTSGLCRLGLVFFNS